MRAIGVLGPADGVDDRRRLGRVPVLANRSEKVRRLQKLVPRNTGDALNHLGRVAGVVLLQKLEDAARMLECKVIGGGCRKRRRRCRGGSGPLRWRISSRAFRQIATLFIVPGSFVICLGAGIKPGKQTVFRQLEAFLHHEGGIGVVEEIILRDAIVLDRVADQSSQKSDVCAGTNLQEEIGSGRRARIARVHHDHFGIAIALCFNRPLESARVVLGWIPAHDQHHVGILDVDPAIGHRPAPECRSQT